MTNKTLQQVCLNGILLCLNTAGAYAAFSIGYNMLGAFIVVCFTAYVACGILNK